MEKSGEMNTVSIDSASTEASEDGVAGHAVLWDILDMCTGTNDLTGSWLTVKDWLLYVYA